MSGFSQAEFTGLGKVCGRKEALSGATSTQALLLGLQLLLPSIESGNEA